MACARRDFCRGSIAALAALGTVPFAWAKVNGRPIKVPLMLDTKRMAIWDGPGMRTTFFVKGCPLKCLWCHNPESIATEQQIARFQHKCQHCQKCRMDEATCPTGAFKIYGKPMAIDQIVEKALEDKAFYDRSGGGVTLSGGEPLFFWEWAFELFSRFKAAGLQTCLDTSLYAPPAAIEKMLPVTDMWLPDYKAHDDALHQKCTGVSNKIIRKNLEYLVSRKVKLEVRCLVVPALTDGADIAARRAYLRKLGVDDKQVVELEYHDYARAKYLALGMPDTMPPPAPPKS